MYEKGESKEIKKDICSLLMMNITAPINRAMANINEFGFSGWKKR
jgi:hypothetical protein